MATIQKFDKVNKLLLSKTSASVLSVNAQAVPSGGKFNILINSTEIIVFVTFTDLSKMLKHFRIEIKKLAHHMLGWEDFETI